MVIQIKLMLNMTVVVLTFTTGKINLIFSAVNCRLRHCHVKLRRLSVEEPGVSSEWAQTTMNEVVLVTKQIGVVFGSKWPQECLEKVQRSPKTNGVV